MQRHRLQEGQRFERRQGRLQRPLIYPHLGKRRMAGAITSSVQVQAASGPALPVGPSKVNTREYSKEAGRHPSKVGAPVLQRCWMAVHQPDLEREAGSGSTYRGPLSRSSSELDDGPDPRWKSFPFGRFDGQHLRERRRVGAKTLLKTTQQVKAPRPPAAVELQARNVPQNVRMIAET